LTNQLPEVLAELQAAGTAQNRKVYARHGVQSEMFGVSFGTLRKLGNKLRPDLELAVALWDTQNHDARLLACMVADPERVSEAQLVRWAKDLDNYIVVDELAALIAKTPYLKPCFNRWKSSRVEWPGALAWTLLAHRAMSPSQEPDEYFEQLLVEIEAKIHARPNRCRHSMNGALIAIGCRNPVLRQRAETVAGRIGRVEVDHGETSCVTPDAAEYIARTWEHKQRKAAKK